MRVCVCVMNACRGADGRTPFPSCRLPSDPRSVRALTPRELALPARVRAAHLVLPADSLRTARMIFSACTQLTISLCVAAVKT